MEIKNFKYEFIDNTQSIEKIESKIKEAIQYLKKLNEPDVIIHDQISYEAIFLIGKFIAYRKDEINFDLFIIENLTELYGDIINYLYDIHQNYELDKEELCLNDPQENANFNQKCLSNLSMILYSINIIMCYNLKFRINFQKTNGLKALFRYLSDEEFIQKYFNLVFDPFGMWKMHFLNLILLSLSNLSFDSQEFKQNWIDLNAVDILIKISELKPSAKNYCYNIILGIANDRQIETLKEINEYSKILINQLKIASNDFKNNYFERYLKQISDGQEIKSIEFHCIKDSNNAFISLHYLFNSLYNLSVNDKLKHIIYFDLNIKSDLLIILSKGNSYEIQYCLKLISQLSLNNKIADDLKRDIDFRNAFNNLNQSDSKLLKKFIDQINWNLDEISVNHSNVLTSNQQHIMISYNIGSRDLCLKLKDKLEKHGYKVWIDVNDIRGSSLDAMAKAIEESFCVLICITEKYRQSVNCQAEAQYAFRINKPIIPLIMQNGFESTCGWLGMIISDKIYVNFVKYSFDECIIKLNKEISSIKKITNPIEDMIVQPERMTQEQVKKWLDINKIDKLIVDYLFNCNGQVLKQIYEMKQCNNQFYVQSLIKIENINMKSIIFFNIALDNLFMNKN